MREPQIVLSESTLSKNEYGLTILGKLITVVLLFVGLFAVEHCFVSGAGAFIIMALTNIAILLALLVKDQQKWTYVKYGILILAVILAILPPSVFINGFLNFANQIIELINNQFNASIATYQVSGFTQGASYKFWAVVNLLISVGLAYFIKKGRIEIIGLIILVIMLTATYFHLAVSPICYGIFVVGLLLSFTGENLFQQRFAKVLPFIVGTVLVAFLVVMLTGGFKGNEHVYNLKEGIKASVDKARYGEDTLPQGNMVDAYDMVGSEDNYTLTLEGTLTNELHLKGFIGSTFTGSRWTVLDGSSYTGEMNGFLKWLSDKDFSSQYQYGQYAKVSGLTDTYNDVTIKNVGAYSKYLYLPYEATSLTTGSGKVNHDWQVTASGIFGESEYQFNMIDISDDVDSIIYKEIDSSTEDGNNYLSAESIYRNFVDTNYLTVPDNEQSLISEKIFEGADWASTNLSEITSKIRLSLQASGNTITKEPSLFNGGEDFVKWFTDGGKKCNSAYYATMGVLAYRQVGIPARYVEGYYVKSSDLSAKKDKVLNVSEANAHAWVEIYVDQIGWIPVEVTPGYYSTEYTTSGVAPSPNSTVNIVQNQDESISGKTSDTLKNQNKKDDQTPPIEKVLHWIGMGILGLLILLLLKIIIEAQAMIRRRAFIRKVEHADNKEEQCRLIFDRVCTILTIYKVAKDFRFPYEYTESFEAIFSGVRAGSYERFLDLIEKSVFSSGEIGDMEYRTVTHFAEKLRETAYGQATFLQKIKLKYIRAI